MLSKKIILGGAQLGNKYGVYSRGTKMKNLNELKKIFKFSINNNLRYIDTAHDYGNSEKVIGQLSSNKFKIISKLNIDTKLSAKNLELFIIKKMNISLKKLKKKKIDILLLHNFDKFFNNKKNLSKIYKVLVKFKNYGIISKIGISTYYPEKIHKFFKIFKYEVVQAPLNIFDQRLLSSKFYNSKSFKNVEIHVRSVFLQGILLKKKYPNYFKKWKKKMKLLLDFIQKNNIDPIHFCLAFVMSANRVKKVIIGVQNLSQLKEIIKKMKKKIKYNKKIFNNFIIKDDKLIIPSYWKVKNV